MDLLDEAEAALLAGRFEAARRRLVAALGELDGAARARGLALLSWSFNHTSRDGAAPAEAALTLAAPGSRDRALALLFLGQARFEAGRTDEAAQRLSEAVEALRALGEEAFAWRGVAFLGLIRARLHDAEGALSLLRRAVDGLAREGDPREAAVRSSAIASILLWRGRRSEAVEALRLGEAHAQGFPEVRSDLLRTRARVADQAQDHDTARRLLEEALALCGEAPSVRRCKVLNDLGDLERVTGDVARARVHLRGALVGAPPSDVAITRLNLALLELEAGDRAAAREVNAPNLEAPPRPWVLVYGRAVGLAAAEDPGEAAAHLAALERAMERGTYAEPDLLALLDCAAAHWEGSERDLAARIAALAHAQAEALGVDVAPSRGRLRSLWASGASVPLGPLAVRGWVRSGGMGQVWRGEVRGADTSSQGAAPPRAPIAVAVKVLTPERAADPATCATLRRELRAVAGLDHPGIVPLIDHGEIPAAIEAMTDGALPAGTPWLATAWADHGTLADWSGRRPFSAVRAALLQLLDALGAAHARGLVHLDVKPANVLVASEAPLRTWLADFGVARALGGAEDHPIAGTPAFMAPEQCLGRARDYGPWTDLYALGALAWTLVQGDPPFEGPTAAVLQQHLARPVPPLRPAVPVPDGFERWCRRLLAKAPEARFRCAADAAAALAALPDAPDAPIAPAERQTSRSSSTFVLDDLLPIGSYEVTNAPPPAVAAFPQRPPAIVPRAAPSPELAAAASRLLPLRPVPLVGRDAARAALWEALRRVEEGPRVVKLAPGSHLLGWLVEAAARVGAATVVRVVEADGCPWREAVARLLHARGLDRGELARRLPSLIRVRVGEAGIPHEPLLELLADGEGDAAGLLVGLVRRLARARRVVLVLLLDDPDAGRVVEALGDAAVLVVAPDAVALEGERIAPGPLDPADAARLLDGLVPLDPDLRDRVAASGDPTAALWTVRAWLADHRLVEGERGLVHDDARVAIPADAVEAVRRLLDPLLAADPRHRARLALAAAQASPIGGRVARAAWIAACGRAEVPWSDELPDALVARGLLVDDEGGWRFAGGPVREAARRA